MNEMVGLVGKRVVLTGAGGFLGRNLLPRLISEGCLVTAVTSKSQAELAGLCEMSANEERLTVVSPGDRGLTQSALNKADYLLNCAFPRNNDGRELAMGLQYISWLFMASAARGTRSVVNISSQSVYSQYRKEPATESDPVCPESPYALAKYATELMLRSACCCVPHVNIRLSSLIGPGFDQRVPNKMVEKAWHGESIEVVDQKGKYGYLDIEDAVEGIVQLIQTNPQRWNNTYNLGPKDAYSIHDIALAVQRVGALHGLSVNITNVSGPDVDINTEVSASLFSEQFGWETSKSLDDSIELIAREAERSRD